MWKPPFYKVLSGSGPSRSSVTLSKDMGMSLRSKIEEHPACRRLEGGRHKAKYLSLGKILRGCQNSFKHIFMG